MGANFKMTTFIRCKQKKERKVTLVSLEIKVIDGEKYYPEQLLKEQQEKAKRQREGYKKKLKKDENSEIQFVNNDMEAIDKIMNDLTRPQRGLLVILLCYLDYRENGGKLINMNKYKKPLNRKDMVNILKCSKQTLSDFLSVCIKNGIMFCDDDEFYSINNNIAFKGGYRDMNRNLVSMMTESMKESLKDLKPVQIGLLYDIQKYINEETMILCKNPNEKDVSKLEYLSQEELAKELGMRKETLYRHMRNLIIQNQYVLGKLSFGGKENRIIVNPNFFFRGSYDKTLEKFGTKKGEVAPMFRVDNKSNLW